MRLCRGISSSTATTPSADAPPAPSLSASAAAGGKPPSGTRRGGGCVKPPAERWCSTCSRGMSSVLSKCTGRERTSCICAHARSGGEALASKALSAESLSAESTKSGMSASGRAKMSSLAERCSGGGHSKRCATKPSTSFACKPSAISRALRLSRSVLAALHISAMAAGGLTDCARERRSSTICSCLVSTRMRRSPLGDV
mmetsp:Transcript_56676/g.130162  ORF Transcript_56676/g.130162 Transcript_56676/m.130162 type:complete len:200 (+) Transcript_56676:624-1223(+)